MTTQSHQEAKHTPTPWTQRISDTGAVDIIHKTDFICTVGVLPYDGNILEDAAHIIHCVNSHDALVAENKRLREALDLLVSWDDRQGACDHIRNRTGNNQDAMTPEESMLLDGMSAARAALAKEDV